MIKTSISSLFVRALLMASVFFGSFYRIEAQNCPGAQNPVTNIGERFTSTVKFQAGGEDRQREIFHPNARYLRARIEVSDPGTCGWLLTVRDADFHVIQTFNQDDFKTISNRWTNRVPSVTRKSGNSTQTISKIVFTLDSCRSGTTPEIKFPEYVMMPATAKNSYYSSQIRGKETFKSLYGLSDSESASTNKPLGDYVGFVMSSWGRMSWTCSGVLLTDNLLLTNWHCGGPGEFEQDGQIVQFPESGYWNPQIVKDTIIDVSFDDDGLSHEYVATKLAAMDPDLDFALLEVSPVDARRRGRPVPISLGPLASGTTIKIVHHPAAQQKMITLFPCQVEGADFPSWRTGLQGTDFTHKCDTEKGSSGAPVFNTNNELVGLHHRGFDVNRATCKERDRVNKAVKIREVYEFLQACHPEVASKLLLTTAPGPPKTCQQISQ